LVLRQPSANVLVSAVFGHVGQATELEGDREHFRDQLGQRFSSDSVGSSLGNHPSGPYGHRIDWDRRDPVPTRPQVPNVGVPTRPSIQETALHIAKKFGEALDKVRAEETRQMYKDGYESVLKNSRWSILKGRSNLTTHQTVKLRELLRYNLKTTKAYLMREDFNRFWSYTSPTWASKFLREWCIRAGRSRIEPIQKIDKTLRKHEPLLLNWFESQGLSSGVVEGFNNKAKLTMRKAYGFKDVETISIALYHQLGNLPEPKRTHKFC
jgi:hypothetical protein